ncbi:RNA-guided endonuclease InsQ/TnpB family protein [Piscibacillus salipiscarius]|uniref:RNA-guided endonuclease InsQ/TnpB family protein n=1 Tax=Piscibacillus salipiscarius TaxID=299480 RepID=UPI0006D0BAC5|nr:RNA-guided endonuclease TnpB family protein [Piscibacillus salipiscarius]
MIYPKKGYHLKPIVKKHICQWQGQTLKVYDDAISVTFLTADGWGRAQVIKANLNSRGDYIREQLRRLQAMLVTIKKINNKWIAMIVLKDNSTLEPLKVENIAGIDLGIKCPIVVKTSNGKIKFIGNGRYLAFRRRWFRSKRKELINQNKSYLVKKIANKEERWMREQDHQLSRELVNYLKENDVRLLKMEKLTGIRDIKTDKKNTLRLHQWSFYRLSQYIQYKCEDAGIQVELVNPKYTSQSCPKCKRKNKTNTRTYRCIQCGYVSHRDIIGATNVLSATTITK